MRKVFFRNLTEMMKNTHLTGKLAFSYMFPVELPGFPGHLPPQLQPDQVVGLDMITTKHS
jgi:hypothetical protein